MSNKNNTAVMMYLLVKSLKDFFTEASYKKKTELLQSLEKYATIILFVKQFFST